MEVRKMSKRYILKRSRRGTRKKHNGGKQKVKGKENEQAK